MKQKTFMFLIETFKVILCAFHGGIHILFQQLQMLLDNGHKCKGTQGFIMSTRQILAVY